MKTKLFILLPILMSALAGCGSKCDHEYSYFISRNSDKRTYIVGDQFDPTGLQVSKKCSKCGDLQKVKFELEVSHTLGLDDKKATITCEGATLEYEFFVKEKYHVAVGCRIKDLSDIFLSLSHIFINQLG